MDEKLLGPLNVIEFRDRSYFLSRFYNSITFTSSVIYYVSYLSFIVTNRPINDYLLFFV